MAKTVLFVLLGLVSTVLWEMASISTCACGTTVAAGGQYRVLPAIKHGNLTVFPVVAATSHDTTAFLTLDEGLKSGEVVVTESGASPLRRGTPRLIPSEGSGQVNQLALVNNSKKPLLLLAGEIVTGGKQDRVIGKDRLIPAESDPIDLGVFCVEPGRWTGSSAKFGALGAIAQPSVRAKAMSDKDQQMVWSEVRNSQAKLAAAAPPPAAREMSETTSYARVMQNDAVKQQVDSVAAPIERGYQSVIQQLREKNAVGVVVAVNGRLIWADLFASNSLLEKYWPKLIRSYAAEAVVVQAKDHDLDQGAAQKFLDEMTGSHQTVESEPGLYRHTEVSGDGFKAFELTSLLPKTGFDLHVAKLAE